MMSTRAPRCSTAHACCSVLVVSMALQAQDSCGSACHCMVEAVASQTFETCIWGEWVSHNLCKTPNPFCVKVVLLTDICTTLAWGARIESVVLKVEFRRGRKRVPFGSGGGSEVGQTVRQIGAHVKHS